MSSPYRRLPQQNSNTAMNLLLGALLVVGIVCTVIWLTSSKFTSPAVGYYPGNLSEGIRYVAIRGVAFFYEPMLKTISTEQYNWKEVAYLDGTYQNYFKFGKNTCWTNKMSRPLKQNEVIKVNCDCPGRVNPKQATVMMVYDQTH